MRSSRTPWSKSTSIALHAEPPVAAISSTIEPEFTLLAREVVHLPSIGSSSRTHRSAISSGILE